MCSILGMDDGAFTAGLKTYEPLPHRLQYLGERDGVKYYDDSISTICDTTIQALKTLKDTDTVLIGGMDRGIDYRELIEMCIRDSSMYRAQRPTMRWIATWPESWAVNIQ